jgi:hypothetical protein
MDGIGAAPSKILQRDAEGGLSQPDDGPVIGLALQSDLSGSNS